MSVSNSNNELRRIIRFEEDGDRKKEFEPVTYTFRVPEKGKKGGSSVLSPPEWLLLDHTIAVVWSLFNSSLSANLDIDDLKWAHEFLKEVRNNKGENPPDVKTCLTEIQNRLISLYAQLTHKEDKSKEQESATVSKTETVIVEPSNSVKEPKQEKDSTKRTNNPSRKQVVPPKEHRKSSQPPSRRESVISSRHIYVRKPDHSRKPSIKKEEDEYITEVFQRKKHSDIVITMPATRRKSRQTDGETTSQDTLRVQSPVEGGKISLQFKKWMTEEELNNEEQAYRNLKNEIRNLMKNPKISKDEVLKFLSNWREEQVQRLESELKRLNSIEEFMRSLEVEGFVPYLQDDTSQRIEVLSINRKMKKPS